MIDNKEIIRLTNLEKKRINSIADDSVFGKNLWNYYQFISWGRFYPDEFIELFKGQNSNFQFHFDQRVFMRCDIRFFSMYGTFSRGYAKCIKGDSLILTEDGIKEIGDLFNYKSDGIETYYDTKINTVNRYGQLETTKLGLYNGKQKCKNIVTDDGFELCGTEIHKILVMDTDGYIKFKKLDEIDIGDYVLISRNNNIWGNTIDISVDEKLNNYIESKSKQSKSHLKVRSMPKIIDENIARIFGYLIGDGCMTLDSEIIFTNIGDSILDDYKKIMLDYFSVSNIRKVSKYDYRISDDYLRKYFQFIGFNYVKADKKSIPECILKAPKNIVTSFLSGLFDTDGTVDNKVLSLSTVSKKLACQVQFILLNCGIISRLKSQKTKSDLGITYKLVISGEDVNIFEREIGFNLQYKKERLRLLCLKKHNTNKNVIPYQKDILKALFNNLHLKSNEKHEFYNILEGYNQLSHQKLDDLFLYPIKNCNEYNHFKEIKDNGYYFSKVSSISDCVEDVYDFHLPDTHSFVSNGFISHNTFDEVLDDIIAGILFPGITLSITAQTKENAAALMEDKYNEIITFFPLLENEIEKTRFAKNDAMIKFKNGSVITNLANAQTSKGRRRHRIKIEESALLNNTLFEDALEPIVEVPRTTVGSLAIVDPEEMNSQINFFTTSGYRGSDEFNRVVSMVNGMRNCTGEIVLGSSWMLPCYYGRGSTKAQILKKKRRSNPIFFAQNYEQKWVGCSDGALVDINKLMACRVLESPIHEIEDGNDEFYIGVDVARSENTGNNQSAISIIKVIRNPNTKRIIELPVVNVQGISNKTNFTEQACIIKKYKNAYRARMVIVDGNGLGAGLVDELLKPSYDKITGEYLGTFDTINTDNKPQSADAEKCLFDMKAQSYQTKVISHFINVVDSGMLKLLIRKQQQDFTDKEREFFDKNVLPFVNTELLFMEISNLKLKVLGNNNLSVEKVVRKIDKDKWSSLVYSIFYVMEFCNKDNAPKQTSFDPSLLSTLYRQPNIYKR